MTPEEKIAHLFADNPLPHPATSESAAAVYAAVLERINDPRYVKALQRADRKRIYVERRGQFKRGVKR